MKNTALLEIQNLNVSVEDKQIVSDVSMCINTGEIHILMGPNGAGKSSLGFAIAGNPRYTIDSGTVMFEGEDITDEGADVRAKSGLFLSFQNPLEIPGITVSAFLKSAYEQVTGTRINAFKFNKILTAAMATLQIEESYAQRDLNVGFSGGEKKKMEMLQLLILRPKLAILDETDSGLDVDAVRTVSKAVQAYHEEAHGTLLIITHNAKILEALKPDYTHVMVSGKLVKTGGADLVGEIHETGFEALNLA